MTEKEKVLNHVFKSEDICLMIQNIDLDLFLEWCYENKLQPAHYWPHVPYFFVYRTADNKCAAAATKAEASTRKGPQIATEKIRQMLQNDSTLKRFAVAYKYDVLPDFILPLYCLVHPDHPRIGYYDVSRDGKYITYSLDKGTARLMLNSDEYSRWRLSVGLEKDSAAWKKMVAKVAMASLLSG
jgi:hypothetical protein